MGEEEKERRKKVSGVTIYVRCFRREKLELVVLNPKRAKELNQEDQRRSGKFTNLPLPDFP
jgi:hypothetical protein